MHLANTQAAFGFIALAIGGILLIWRCSKPPLGPKPQPREDLRPAIDDDCYLKANDLGAAISSRMEGKASIKVERPAPVRPAGKASTHVSGVSNRKRDKRGKFTK